MHTRTSGLGTMSDLTGTYSIVAFDAKHEQLGVAVQTHQFGVGTMVPWVEPGVGAVATQSFLDVFYGPLGLSLMRGGKSASQALDALLTTDSRIDIRQVAMVDTRGDVAAHTGGSCVEAAGHHVGDGFSTQANLMWKDTVWDEMARAYEGATGDLADRMIAAMEAAEGEGGDLRGRQSAALLVASSEATEPTWAGRLFDLRVDDHESPVEELRRLLAIARAYSHRKRAIDTLESSPGDEDTLAVAREEFAVAVSFLPDFDPEFHVWYAVTLAGTGHIDTAVPLLRDIVRAEPTFRDVLLPRLVKAGLLPGAALALM